MLRRYILHSLCLVVVMLALINALAVFLHWYDLIWWFDMPMHFFGGMSVFYGAAFVWRGALKWASPARYIYESIITALLIGVLWEALELYLNITYGSPGFHLTDAISDIFFDLAGAFFAAYLLVPVMQKYISSPGFVSKRV